MAHAKLLATLATVKLEQLGAYNPETKEFEWKTAPPHTFEVDGVVHVSGEHGDGAIDYYGEFRGGYPWINPQIEEVAKKCGYHIEWFDPGSIAFYKE
jgi:hypothetical protein